VKKILILRSNPIKPDPRVEKIASSLVNLGYSVTILGWNRERFHRTIIVDGNFLSKGITLLNVGIKAFYSGGFIRNFIPLLKFQFEIFKFIVKNYKSIDAIHACDFDTAYISRKISKIFRIKFVYDIFDFYIDSFNVPKILRKLILSMDIKTINNSQAVIICTDQRVSQLKNAKPKKIYVIHNSPSSTILEHSHNNYSSLDLKPKISVCYVGLLIPNRLLEEIFSNFKLFNKFNFHVGGYGPLSDFIESKAKNFDNLHFYGRIDYKKTLELERDSNILFAVYNPLIPNHKFSAPNKLYEALYLGKPIIVAKETGIDTLVVKNDFGFAIDYSVYDFLNKLNEYEEKKSFWLNNSSRLHDYFNKNYAWNIMEERLKALYKSL
jgi:glycosyltransferase involved in cell wall biosynthesis